MALSVQDSIGLESAPPPCPLTLNELIMAFVSLIFMYGLPSLTNTISAEKGSPESDRLNSSLE